MISKFETGSLPGAESKGGNGLLYLVLAAGLAYAGYHFLIKPELEKDKVRA